jgi:hypothetical protein
MALDPTKGDRTTPLDHLHPATDAQHGQPARLCDVKNRILSGIPFRGIATESGKVVAAGQH